MNRAVNLGPTPAATQEQRTADILAFERVKALPPGVHDYGRQIRGLHAGRRVGAEEQRAAA